MQNMYGSVYLWIAIVFLACNVAGCIIVPIPPGQQVYIMENNIKELLDNSANRETVINKLGPPARQYQKDISYRACRTAAGYHYADVIFEHVTEHSYHGDTECYELVLHFDRQEQLKSYEKILFDPPFSHNFKTPDGVARPTIRMMAEKGFPEHQWRLYNDYGQKPRDIIWLCRSAENGYARAQLHVGSLYWSSPEIPRNKIKAYVWYKLAATGDRLQGLLPDKEAQNDAQVVLSDAKYSLSTEELTKAEALYADWEAGECEVELSPQFE